MTTKEYAMLTRTELAILVFAIALSIGNFFLLGATPGYFVSLALLLGVGISGSRRWLERRRIAKAKA